MESGTDDRCIEHIQRVKQGQIINLFGTMCAAFKSWVGKGAGVDPPIFSVFYLPPLKYFPGFT